MSNAGTVSYCTIRYANWKLCDGLQVTGTSRPASTSCSCREPSVVTSLCSCQYTMLYLHRINTPWRAVAAAVLCVLMLDSPGCFVARVQGFAPRPHLLSSQRQCRFIGGGSFRLEPRSTRNRKQSSSKTSLNMFLGSDGGILGIGTPEVVCFLCRFRHLSESLLPRI
jgi:hypothetical protein